MSQKLTELFNKKRQEALQEDFQVGQAAQALQELKRSAKEYAEFLDGPFTETFKSMHNDPRNIEDNVNKLAKALRDQQARLAAVAQEMDAYLDDADSYLNPQSMHHGKQHENRVKNRWARWEHQPPRDRNAVDDE